jgi:hypothetical protein
VSGLPARPDVQPGAIRPGRRWLPVWTVTAVIAVTVLGGFVTAAALPAPPARRVAIGDAIVLHPLEGWAVVRRDRTTLANGAAVASFVQLSRGNGALDVLAISGLPPEAETAATFYAEEVLRRQLERLSVSGLEPVVLRSGLSALRFGYIGNEPTSGSAIEGAVTVTVGASGTVAIFDGWGAEGQLELLLEELRAMIDAAEVS